MGVRPKLRQLADLVVILVGRDIKVKYKRSVIGLTWSLLNPLAQLLVFRLVFGSLLHLSIPDYTLFLFTGILVWNWFQGSLYAATGSVVENGTLLRQPGFPTAVLPVAAIASNLVQFLLAFPILIGGALLTGHPSMRSLWAEPLVILAQFVLTLSLAYLLAAVHVRLRDTQHLVGIILMLGLYLAPVFYRASAVPGPFQSWFRLNPMVPVLEAHREVLLAGHAPAWPALAAVTGGSLLLLAFSTKVFARAAYYFADEI
jgi:lipopolysaccharide transport system permease protein